MPLSKTQYALSYVKRGDSPAFAAEKAGIAYATLRAAISKRKGKELCPCCRQVVRAGFNMEDIRPALAKAEERERIAALAIQERLAATDPVVGRAFGSFANLLISQ